MEKTSNQLGSEDLYFDSLQFSKIAHKAHHAFFGRQGGVSKGVYASLNCGRGSDDNPNNVKHNLNIVSEIIGLSGKEIATVHQVHGKECVYVDQSWPLDKRPEADALVTDKIGIPIGVLTADCTPVLFYGEKSNGSPVIGAAHAGWKGAVGGILESTVEKIKELGAKNTVACIGPCIAQSSYEVSEAFFEAFEDEDHENERFFKASSKSGHLMFDLAGYCASKLSKLGLKNVFIKDLDTYFNEEDFFSYRRATHRGEKDYGRQISLIYIK